MSVDIRPFPVFSIDVFYSTNSLKDTRCTLAEIVRDAGFDLDKHVDIMYFFYFYFISASK